MVLEEVTANILYVKHHSCNRNHKVHVAQYHWPVGQRISWNYILYFCVNGWAFICVQDACLPPLKSQVHVVKTLIIIPILLYLDVTAAAQSWTWTRFFCDCTFFTAFQFVNGLIGDLGSVQWSVVSCRINAILQEAPRKLSIVFDCLTPEIRLVTFEVVHCF